MWKFKSAYESENELETLQPIVLFQKLRPKVAFLPSPAIILLNPPVQPSSCHNFIDNSFVQIRRFTSWQLANILYIVYDENISPMAPKCYPIHEINTRNMSNDLIKQLHYINRL